MPGQSLCVIAAYREEAKDVDIAFKKGGQRDWKQVRI